MHKVNIFDKSRKNNLISEINVTPIVDVMLVLLIVFMVTSPLLLSNVSIKLPYSENFESYKDDNDSIEISITKDKKIFLLNTLLSKKELFEKMKSICEEKKVMFKKIKICADSVINYGYLMEIIDVLKNLGFNKISLITSAERVD